MSKKSYCIDMVVMTIHMLPCVQGKSAVRRHGLRRPLNDWDGRCINSWDCPVAVWESEVSLPHANIHIILTFTTHVRKAFYLVQSYVEATCVGYDAFVSQGPHPLKTKPSWNLWNSPINFLALCLCCEYEHFSVSLPQTRGCMHYSWKLADAELSSNWETHILCVVPLPIDCAE